MNFKDCLSKGLIRKDKFATERIKTSLEIAERFLKSSWKNLEIEEFEMAEIASYNAIFHSARALLFNKGYTERSHFCVILALNELYKNDYELVDLVNDPTSKECGLLVSSGNIVALHKAKSLG